jgi:hypothetical protein
MPLTINSNVNFPGSGPFGTGNVQVFGVSGTWTVPPAINNVRVRVFGGGGGSYGGGGGFAMETIYNLAGAGVTSVAVTVAGSTTGTGGTSSFGSYCSATGGTPAGVGGTGVGGDINTTGGTGVTSQAGGGVANMWGDGGGASPNGSQTGISGASGGGAGGNVYGAGSGLTGAGGWINTTYSGMTPQAGNPTGSLDFIGTGGGGGYQQAGVNGGGGGYNGSGGFPGGGGATRGAAGLVIVEY